jgi:hypothetical protein
MLALWRGFDVEFFVHGVRVLNAAFDRLAFIMFNEQARYGAGSGLGYLCKNKFVLVGDDHYFYLSVGRFLND